MFALLKKDTAWKWSEIEQEAFDLAKEALVNSPVRAYAIPGRGYRLYSDACDIGIACILQQVQPMFIKDLKGTSIYVKLKSAYDKGSPLPRVTPNISKTILDVPEPGAWADNFEETEIFVE